MDALSAKYAVCMQTSALNNQLYADKWGSGWAKQWLIMLKKMPISLQNSPSPRGEGECMYRYIITSSSFVLLRACISAFDAKN